jgi:hypothetical protein
MITHATSVLVSFKMVHRTPKPADPDILIGLDEIGSALGFHRWTIRRWIARHGFPAGRLPNGMWITSRELVRSWILARNEADPDLEVGRASDEAAKRPD